jgi:hypothetical protein
LSHLRELIGGMMMVALAEPRHAKHCASYDRRGTCARRWSGRYWHSAMPNWLNLSRSTRRLAYSTLLEGVVDEALLTKQEVQNGNVFRSGDA